MAKRGEKDEYQHPEDVYDTDEVIDVEEEIIDDGEPVAKAPFSFKQLLLSKKILVPVIIVASIYAVYWFMGVRDAKRAAIKQEQAVAVKPVEAPKPKPQQPVVQQVVREAPSVLPDLQEDVKDAEQRLKQNASKIDAIAKQMEQLQSAQSQITSELSGLNEHISDLTLQMQVLAEKLEKQKKPVKKATRTKKRAVKPAYSYHLKAVIPGRAWIQRSDGVTLTVKVGESLRGYGTIKGINANSGVVFTSTGRKITYGKYDS